MPATTQQVCLIRAEAIAAGQQLGPALAGRSFALVLTSPHGGARESCEQAGLGARAVIDPDLGEETGPLAARVDRVIARVRASDGNVVLFAHGSVLRAFVARWLGLPVASAEHFVLGRATMNILVYCDGAPALKTWNAPLALTR